MAAGTEALSLSEWLAVASSEVRPCSSMADVDTGFAYLLVDSKAVWVHTKCCRAWLREAWYDHEAELEAYCFDCDGPTGLRYAEAVDRIEWEELEATLAFALAERMNALEAVVELPPLVSALQELRGQLLY